MKKLYFLAAFLFASVLSAQTLQEFSALLQANDTIGQQELLKKWKKKGLNDPDYYVAAFNYNVNKGMVNGVGFRDEPEDERYLEMVNTEDSTQVFYMVDERFYEKEYINEALIVITAGIEKFPDRLDMRFGKIHVLGEAEDYDAFTKEVIKVIDYSDKINNKWKWIGGELMDDGKDFMLENVQAYTAKLYDTNNDDLLVNMVQISETVLKYYHDSVESLSNLGVVSVINEDFKTALQCFLKAESYREDDIIVLANIANLYVREKDYDNAEKYYGKIAKYGNDEDVAFAQDAIRQIQELKKGKK